MTPKPRHLTPAAKAEILARWEETKRQPRLRDVPGGELAGRGGVDPDIVAFCDHLNAMEGIATLQSCAGHRVPARGDGGEDPGETVVYPGNLWLWLDRDVSRAFHAHAFELAREPLVERVEVMFEPEGEEIVSITFRGNEEGKLAHSLLVIGEFLGRMRLEAAATAEKNKCLHCRVWETINNDSPAWPGEPAKKMYDAARIAANLIEVVAEVIAGGPTRQDRRHAEAQAIELLKRRVRECRAAGDYPPAGTIVRH